MRIVHGALGAGVTLAILASGIAVINWSARTWAARRLAEKPNDVNAEAVLGLF